MATMEIDGIRTQLEYDPDEDHFYGWAELAPGQVATFFGRDPDELRERFRESRAALEEVLARAGA